MPSPQSIKKKRSSTFSTWAVGNLLEVGNAELLPKIVNSNFTYDKFKHHLKLAKRLQTKKTELKTLTNKGIKKKPLKCIAPERLGIFIEVGNAELLPKIVNSNFTYDQS